MLITRALVERLEAVEVQTVVRLARALARVTADPAVEVLGFGDGALVATGPDRYVNRAVGITLGPLDAARVDEVVGWYDHRGLPPSVQLSSWAPPATVAALASRGFVPTGSRSVLVRPVPPDPVDTGPGAGVEVVTVDDRTAADARDVMAADAGADRRVPDEFMTADRGVEGTT